jgi:PEP-CTERM motif
MNKLLLAGAMFLINSSSVLADSLFSGSSSASSSAFNSVGNFWSNVSSDLVNGSGQANVGNFLADTGAFALNGNVTANCGTCGINYMAAGGQMYVNNGNTPNYVSGLNFVTGSGGLQITLLYANSPMNSLASFGLYDQSNPANHLVLQQAGVNLNNSIGSSYMAGTEFAGTTNLGAYNLSNGSPYSSWGLYVTTCAAAATSVAACTSSGNLVTYYMGLPSALNAGQSLDSNHEHFALFQSGTNVNQYYVAVEDSVLTGASTNDGDYNDLIFGVTSSIPEAPVPLPSSVGLLGIGLAGLAFARRRRRFA